MWLPGNVVMAVDQSRTCARPSSCHRVLGCHRRSSVSATQASPEAVGPGGVVDLFSNNTAKASASSARENRGRHGSTLNTTGRACRGSGGRPPAALNLHQNARWMTGL